MKHQIKISQNDESYSVSKMNWVLYEIKISQDGKSNCDCYVNWVLTTDQILHKIAEAIVFVRSIEYY